MQNLQQMNSLTIIPYGKTAPAKQSKIEEVAPSEQKTRKRKIDHEEYIEESRSKIKGWQNELKFGGARLSFKDKKSLNNRITALDQRIQKAVETTTLKSKVAARREKFEKLAQMITESAHSNICAETLTKACRAALPTESDSKTEQL